MFHSKEEGARFFKTTLYVVNNIHAERQVKFVPLNEPWISLMRYEKIVEGRTARPKCSKDSVTAFSKSRKTVLEFLNVLLKFFMFTSRDGYFFFHK